MTNGIIGCNLGHQQHHQNDLITTSEEQLHQNQQQATTSSNHSGSTNQINEDLKFVTSSTTGHIKEQQANQLNDLDNGQRSNGACEHASKRNQGTSLQRSTITNFKITSKHNGEYCEKNNHARIDDDSDEYEDDDLSDDENNGNMYNDRVSCGWVSFRPRFLMKFATIQVFVFFSCILVTLQQALSSGYFNSVMTTIEKRFDIPSRVSGAIISTFELGNLLTILFVSYFGTHRHIPVWIGKGIVITGIGSLLFALPHFMDINNPLDSYLLNNVASQLPYNQPMQQNKSHYHHQAAISTFATTEPIQYDANMCQLLKSTPKNEALLTNKASPVVGMQDPKAFSQSNHGSMPEAGADIKSCNIKSNLFVEPHILIFMLAMILIGCGGTPVFTLGTTFIDDHVPKESSSMYIGFMYSMVAFGLVIGFLLGGYLIGTVNENTYTNSFSYLIIGSSTKQLTSSQQLALNAIHPGHPRWIGAWWLGFIILGVSLILISIPFFAFPKSLKVRGSSIKRRTKSRCFHGDRSAKIVLNNNCDNKYDSNRRIKNNRTMSLNHQSFNQLIVKKNHSITAINDNTAMGDSSTYQKQNSCHCDDLIRDASSNLDSLVIKPTTEAEAICDISSPHECIVEKNQSIYDVNNNNTNKITSIEKCPLISDCKLTQFLFNRSQETSDQLLSDDVTYGHHILTSETTAQKPNWVSMANLFKPDINQRLATTDNTLKLRQHIRQRSHDYKLVLNDFQSDRQLLLLNESQQQQHSKILVNNYCQRAIDVIPSIQTKTLNSTNNAPILRLNNHNLSVSQSNDIAPSIDIATSIDKQGPNNRRAKQFGCCCSCLYCDRCCQCIIHGNLAKAINIKDDLNSGSNQINNIVDRKLLRSNQYSSRNSSRTFVAKSRDKDLSNYGKDLKDIPRCMWNLLMNPIYIVTCLGSSLELAIVSGFLIFLPKYLETQFGLSKSQSSLYSGGIAVPGACFGILFGGYVLKRFQMKPKSAIQFVLFVNLLCIGFYTILYFLGCPNPLMAGATMGYSDSTSFNGDTSKYGTNHYNERRIDTSEGASPLVMDQHFKVNLTSECNIDCQCNPNDIEPVCGEDGITYFSPCHAGCSLMTDTTAESDPYMNNYGNCGCVTAFPAISRPIKYSSSQNISSKSRRLAKSGSCPHQCQAIVPFMVLLFFLTLVVSITQMPLLMVTLRSVKDEERSFALGMQFVIFRLLAYIPAPILFGNVIDGTCLLWKANCGPQSGFCLIYDIEHFRLRYVGLFSALKVIAGLLFFLDWFLICWRSDKLIENPGRMKPMGKIASSLASLDRLSAFGLSTDMRDDQDQDTTIELKSPFLT